MERQIIIQEISKEELLEAINTTVKNQFNILKHDLSTPKESEELLSRKEVMEMLKISEVTLWKWSKGQRIRVYKINSRNYYKRSEIEAALTLKH